MNSKWQELLLGGGLILRSLRGLIIFFVTLVIIHLFVMTLIIIDGESMNPTLSNREWIFINKIVRTSALKRGDIVVFHDPSYPKRNFIKRVIGLPGETIEVKQGALFVDGIQLEEDYLPADFRTEALQEQDKFNVEDGTYFLSGDNRSRSNDSRAFGPIDQQKIVGTAMFSVAPTFQVFTRPYYPPVNRAKKDRPTSSPSPSPSPSH